MPSPTKLYARTFATFNTQMKEFPLEQVEIVLSRMRHQSKDGIFQINLRIGESVEMDKIPFAQLNRLDEITPLLLALLKG